MHLIGRLRFTEIQLLVVPSALTIVGLLTIYFASTRDLDWNWRDIWLSLAFMIVVVAMSLCWCREIGGSRWAWVRV